MVTSGSLGQMAIVEEVLQRVCEESHFAHAEVLQATETGMILAAANFCKSDQERSFHEESKSFTFPLQVGIPGRVWMHRKVEWHSDVLRLPAHKFLRREIAIEAGLKGCVAVPYQHESAEEEGPPTVLVLIFYADRAICKEDVHTVVTSVKASSSELNSRGITPVARRKRGSVDEQVQQLQWGSPVTSPSRAPMTPPLAPALAALNPEDLSLASAVQDEDHGLEGVERVLRRVCEESGMTYAETLRPSQRGMVLSRARFCKGAAENKFYLESRSFTFPLQVGIPGRVWNRRKMEWHADVTALPAFKFLRRLIAITAGLKGCIAVPFQIEDAFYVSSFYSQNILESEDVEALLRCLAAVLAEEDGSELAGHESRADANGGRSDGSDIEDGWIERRASVETLAVVEEDDQSPHSAPMRSDTLDSKTGSESVSSPDNTMHGDEAFTRGESVACAKNEIREEDMTIEVMLGEGSSGHVYRALYSSHLVAVKFLKVEHLNDRMQMKGFYREAAILSHIKHPNVVGMVGVCMRRRPPLLLYELCECTLEQYVEKKQATKGWKFNVRKVKGWATGLASALELLSSLGLVHRDIKPSNALLAKNREVLKLADLGLCEGEEPQYVRSIVLQHFGQSATAIEGEEGLPVTEIVGTFRYMAPEVWSGRRICSQMGDMYSMAMVLWYMCTGFPPFRDATQEQLAKGFIHQTQRREDLSLVSNQPMAKIIEMAWAEDPLERPTASEVSARLREIKVPKMIWPSAGSFHLKKLTKWRSSPSLLRTGSSEKR